MRVIKKSHPNVIYQKGTMTQSDDIAYMPGGESSAIVTGITKEKTRNVTGQAAAITSDITKRSLSKDLIEEDIFHYTVFFDCDLRAAMDHEISTLDYRIYSRMPNTKYDFFHNYEKNPLSLVKAIYSSQRLNTDRIRGEVKNATIKEGKVSILDRVNSNLIRARKKMSDDVLFGRRYETIVSNKATRDKEYSQKSKLLSQIQFSTVDKSIIGDTGNTESSYYSLISKGVDPSIAFNPVVNMQKVMGEENSSVKKNINTGIIGIDTSLNKLRSECEYQSQFPDMLSKGKSHVACRASVSNRYQTIPLSFKMRSSEIPGQSKFIVQILLRDKKTKLIGQVLNINVDHKAAIGKCNIPEEIPNISVASSQVSTTISCQSHNVNSKSTSKVQELAISHRNINSFSNLIESKTKTTITSNNEYTLAARGVSESSMQIIRVSPVLSDGRILGNFKSAVSIGKSFNPTTLSINALSAESGIKVFISNITYDIIGVTILRRIVGEETGFKTINYIPDSSKSRDQQENLNLFPDSFNRVSAHLLSRSDLTSLGSDVQTSGQLNVIDGEVTHGKTYEYKAKIRRLHGGDEIYPASAIEKFIPPSNTVAVLSNLIRSDISGIFNGPEGPYTGKSITCNIMGAISQTKTTKILQIILNAGLQDIFSDEIETFKASLSDKIIYSVTRYCFSTDEIVFLGYFSDEFTDRGLWVNRDYRYKVEAYLFNPKEVSDNIVDGLKNLNVIKDISSLILPSSISKLKKAAIASTINQTPQITLADDVLATSRLKTMQETFSSSKLSKNYSKSSQLGGTIESTDKKSQEYDIEKYPTGDYAIVVVNGDPPSLAMSLGGEFFLTDNGYPLLKIRQTGLSNQGHVDFLSITCLRQGKYSVVGPCDPSMASNSGEILFIDYINKDYIGKIAYYATPFMIDGTMGKKIKICEGMLGKRDNIAHKKVKYSSSQGRIRKNG